SAIPHTVESSRDHTLVALPRPAPTNLPWMVSSLIGRERDVTAIRALIDTDHQRLVTLIGVGGSGKTRLAVQVGRDLLSTPAASPSRPGISFDSQARSGPTPTSGQGFADGVWFVELAPTSSPELLPRVVAGVLGVREVQEAPILDALLGFLR